jgi:hypothetical protein
MTLSIADSSTSPSLHYGIHSTVLDSYHDLNGTIISNVTNANLTGREKVLAVIATNSTFNITPSFTSTMADDAKK